MSMSLARDDILSSHSFHIVDSYLLMNACEAHIASWLTVMSIPTPGNASKYLLLAQVNKTVANMLASCKHGEFGVNKCSRVN